MKNNYIKPEIGKTYTLRNGGEYRCLWISNTDRLEQGECSAVLIRDSDGWKLTVHGLQQNEKGMVEWDYSTGGHWEKNSFEVWKDSELGPTYMEKSFSTKEEAEEWISSHEKSYPGWHLRIEEKYIEPKPSLDSQISSAEEKASDSSPTNSISKNNEYYEENDGFFSFYVNKATGEKKFSLSETDVLVERNQDDFSR